MSRNKKVANKNQNNKKGAGYKPDQNREYDKDKEMEGNGGVNDPSWYANDPALLRDAASINWTAAAGVLQKIGTSDFPYNDKVTDAQGYIRHRFPRLNQSGAQIIKIAPTIGRNKEAASPVNIAMNSLYTKVRYQNSGHTNYDAPDLMIYTLAMADIYSNLNWLIRIYGIANLYTQRNRFVPEQLLEAEGVDFDSIRNNLPSLRYGINLLIAKAASLCVPASFSVFVRRAFLYTNVYTEGTSMKDQLYLYSPEGFYKYKLNSDGSGMLEYSIRYDRTGVATLKTYTDLLNDCNDLLDAIIQSEDCQTMSGDILKAYGDSGVIKLGTISPDYTVTPIFDIGVLEQMKNATIFPGYFSQNDIVQDANHAFLECDPQWSFCESGTPLNMVDIAKAVSTAPLITTSLSETGPALVMENSRLISYLEDWTTDLVDGVYWYTGKVICGTEVAVDVWDLAFDYKNTSPTKEYPARYFTRDGNTGHYNKMFGRPADADIFVTMSQLQNFKFGVGFWVVDTRKSDDPDPMDFNDYVTYAIDLDNFAILSPDVLRNIHETAIMSELNTPAINRLG